MHTHITIQKKQCCFVLPVLLQESSLFLLSSTFLFCWYFLRRVLLYYGYDNLIGEDIDIWTGRTGRCKSPRKSLCHTSLSRRCSLISAAMIKKRRWSSIVVIRRMNVQHRGWEKRGRGRFSFFFLAFFFLWWPFISPCLWIIIQRIWNLTRNFCCPSRLQII